VTIPDQIQEKSPNSQEKIVLNLRNLSLINQKVDQREKYAQDLLQFECFDYQFADKFLSLKSDNRYELR